MKKYYCLGSQTWIDKPIAIEFFLNVRVDFLRVDFEELQNSLTRDSLYNVLDYVSYVYVEAFVILWGLD